jgi:hypothetical protein
MSNAIKNNPRNLPFVANGAVPAKVFVSPAGAVAAAGGNSLGVNDFAVAIGECMQIDNMGETCVLSGAALAANAEVMSNGSGKAITYVSNGTNVKLGRLSPIAGNTASAADQMVAIVLISN